MLQKLKSLFNRRNSNRTAQNVPAASIQSANHKPVSAFTVKTKQYPSMSANEWGDLYHRDPEEYKKQLDN